MQRKAITFAIIGLVIFLAACGPAVTATSQPTSLPAATTAAPTAAEPVELTVFAAASLTNAFTEIGTMFEAENSNVTIAFNFAGSNQLAEQIVQGAPADVFASANNAQLEVAVESGRIDAEAAQVFVRNRLVVIYPTGNPAGLADLQGLAEPGLKLVLAAVEVPVGQYSLDFLDKASQNADFGPAFKDAVLANVVSYEENVRSVLTKVALGEADAGIVYTSDISGDDAGNVERIDIPDDLNTIATYPIAPLNDSEHAEAAHSFVDLVLSPEGQDILLQYGFIPAAGS